MLDSDLNALIEAATPAFASKALAYELELAGAPVTIEAMQIDTSVSVHSVPAYDGQADPGLTLRAAHTVKGVDLIVHTGWALKVPPGFVGCVDLSQVPDGLRYRGGPVLGWGQDYREVCLRFSSRDGLPVEIQKGEVIGRLVVYRDDPEDAHATRHLVARTQIKNPR